MRVRPDCSAWVRQDDGISRKHRYPNAMAMALSSCPPLGASGATLPAGMVRLRSSIQVTRSMTLTTRKDSRRQSKASSLLCRVVTQGFC